MLCYFSHSFLLFFPAAVFNGAAFGFCCAQIFWSSDVLFSFFTGYYHNGQLILEPWLQRAGFFHHDRSIWAEHFEVYTKIWGVQIGPNLSGLSVSFPLVPFFEVICHTLHGGATLMIVLAFDETGENCKNRKYHVGIFSRWARQIFIIFIHFFIAGFVAEDYWKIAINYLSTWFILDCATWTLNTSTFLTQFLMHPPGLSVFFSCVFLPRRPLVSYRMGPTLVQT